jgi:hypothetical protein
MNKHDRVPTPATCPVPTPAAGPGTNWSHRAAGATASPSHPRSCHADRPAAPERRRARRHARLVSVPESVCTARPHSTSSQPNAVGRVGPFPGLPSFSVCNYWLYIFVEGKMPTEHIQQQSQSIFKKKSKPARPTS